jgi:hypothetical protein
LILSTDNINSRKSPLSGSASNLLTGGTTTEFRSSYVPSLTVVQITLIVQGVTVATAIVYRCYSGYCYSIQGVTLATATVYRVLPWLLLQYTGVTVATATVYRVLLWLLLQYTGCYCGYCYSIQMQYKRHTQYGDVPFVSVRGVSLSRRIQLLDATWHSTDSECRVAQY